jgi:DNA-binding MarR family transcriptional regulator
MSYAKYLMPQSSPASAPQVGVHDEDLAAEAAEIRMSVFRFARRMRAERAVDSMSDGQFAVLAALKVHGPHTLGELADRERISPPSMNRTVNCLEEAGYLDRAPDADDGRKVRISLTPAGLGVVQETTRRRDEWVEESLAALSSDERLALATAADVLRRMADR